MKSIPRALPIFLKILAICPFAAFADNVNVSGNITTTGGNVIAQTGRVQAQTYFYTPGYLQTGTSGNFGTSIAVGTYGTFGSFVNIGSTLKVGASSVATGTNSAALGAAANATSYSCVVVGRNNVTTASDGAAATAGTWVNKDPLFIVGNGTGAAGADQYRNAFVVYKDGTISMSKAQGDILMGQFGN